MKAIVLAGGKGRRLEPYTRIIPKPLMPIGDMPILEVLLRQMKRADITDVVLTVGYLADYMKLFFQNGQKLGLNITYSHESKPLGTAGPLALVDGLEDTFLVSNGDVLTTMDMRKLIEFHKAQNAAATISTHTRKVSIDLGVVVPGNDHNITGYIEKPTYDYLVSMGIYVFEPRVLSYIPKDEYLDFPDLVKHLLDAGEKVSSYQFNGYWQDLGRPDDYERASLDFEEMRSQFLPEE